MEVRACIEPSVTARAARRATPADIVQLHALLDAMRRELTRREFTDLDRTFHRAIAQYTRNPLLLRLLDRVYEIGEPGRRAPETPGVEPGCPTTDPRGGRTGRGCPAAS
ncbi:FCD domain-containing protein [Streptomyces antimycoticus]|uniref:FCD domain-containing protein n=1 Tax=Streptomyces antimycoticus TaxID=68175 RepID=UPI003409422D